MPLPLWDDIPIPPDHTLVDINSLTPDSMRLLRQSEVLQLWMDETGDGPENFVGLDWSDDDGIFVIVEDATGDHVGIQIIVDSEYV